MSDDGQSILSDGEDATCYQGLLQHSVSRGSLDEEFGSPEGRREFERELVWKIDLRMSVLLVIYILNHIDRNNAAAARLRGMEEDLHLEGQQFATLLGVLYIGYMLFQVPSNMFLNKTGKPSLYIPACMIFWGMISIFTGIAKNFTEVLLARFFLGIFEAAFFPGALLMLSKWYTRKELGLRISMLFCGSLISNAFGNLIAAAVLDNMEGKLGHRAWRWLFYIEGTVTMFVAVIATFVLPDFPATTSWLTPLERRFAEARMTEDVGEGDSDNTGALRGLYLALTDRKVWWLSVASAAQSIALSFNQYFPTLTATLGYSRTITLLLCAPPWVFATIVAFVNARHSDKTGEKFFHIFGPEFISIAGFIVIIGTENIAARYAAFFLMAQANAGNFIFYSWISPSLPRPPAKRAVALAFINSFTQLGSIAGSYCFPTNWGPSYRKSYSILFSSMVLSVIMSFIFRAHLMSLNKRMDRGKFVDFGQGSVLSSLNNESVRRAANMEEIDEVETVRRRETFRYLV